MAKKKRFDFSSDSLDGIDGFEFDETGRAFDEEEAADEQEVPETDSPVQGSSSGSGEPDEESEDDEDIDLDLEKNVAERLQVATLYGLLLKSPLFEQKSPSSVRIEKEVRHFIQGRLKTLLGIGGPAVVGPALGGSDFSAEEISKLRSLVPVVEILSAMAEKLAARGFVQSATPNSVNPVSTTAPAEKQISVAALPAQKKAAPVAAPKMLPLQKTLQKQIPPAPQKPPAAQKAPSQKQAASARPSLEKVNPIYRDDPTLESRNGQWFVIAKDDDGNPRTLLDPKTKKRRPLWKNVTIQVPGRSGPQPLPTPSVDVSNQMAVMAAASGLQALDARLGGAGVASNLVTIQAVNAANRVADSDQDEEERP